MAMDLDAIALNCLAECDRMTVDTTSSIVQVLTGGSPLYSSVTPNHQSPHYQAMSHITPLLSSPNAISAEMSHLHCRCYHRAGIAPAA